MLFRSLREISKKSGVPVASTFRIINRLLSMNLIRLVRINKFKLYKLANTKETDFLKNILKKDKNILGFFVDRIKDVEGISQVILHGREAKDKANILLIGENINPSLVKALTYEIKQQYNFNISSLSLTHEQYRQMLSMGLYSGEKKNLFTRGR